MKITRVFLEVDMRMNFDGLREITNKHNTQTGPESTIVFLNKASTKFKVLRSNQYLVYYSNGNKRIPLEALRDLPNTFGGSEFEFSEAVKKSLLRKLKGFEQ